MSGVHLEVDLQVDEDIIIVEQESISRSLGTKWRRNAKAALGPKEEGA